LCLPMEVSASKVSRSSSVSVTMYFFRFNPLKFNDLNRYTPQLCYGWVCRRKF
jgi:hypothetical protein